MKADSQGDLFLRPSAVRGALIMDRANLPRVIKRRSAAPGSRPHERRRGNPCASGIQFRAFETGETYFASDVNGDPHYTPFFAGTRSSVAVPVVVKELQDEKLGVLLVESERAEGFGEAEVARIETLVRDVALPLLKALVYEQTKKDDPRNPVLLVGLPRSVLDDAVLAATATAPLLLEGESGTGKEMLARFIHAIGPRRKHRFVTLNCAELSQSLAESQLFGHVKGAFTGAEKDTPGIFECAGQGTVFIDEVQRLPIELQSKFLRVLEQGVISPVGAAGEIRRIPARVIAATSQNLQKWVDEERFLKDLFYRLDVLRIRLPALRENRSAVLRIAQTLLREVAERNNRNLVPLTPIAERFLREYSHPGNIRELRNILERAIIRDKDGRINEDDLPPEITQAVPKRLTDSGIRSAPLLKANEDGELRGRIIQTLKLTKGKVALAARMLDIDRRVLYRHFKRFGIDPERYR